MIWALVFFSGFSTAQEPADPAAQNPATAVIEEPVPQPADGVTGRISYSQELPKAKPIKIFRDRGVCGEVKARGDLLVDEDGGLANAVVIIEGLSMPEGFEPEQVELDQNTCEYRPHVMAFPVGTEVLVRNSDPVLHNVHARTRGRTLFNLATPIKGMSYKRKVRTPGVAIFGCDVGHTWMRAYAYVAEHPYLAVTAADGTFSIQGVPPGVHPVRVWHEKAGEKTAEIKVSIIGRATLELAY